MSEIKCPHCGEKFTIDQNNYANIVRQIRNKEFNEEIDVRLEAIEEKYRKDLELTQEKSKSSFEKILAQKEHDIISLNTKIENFSKEKEIEIINSKKELERKILEQEKLIADLSSKNKELNKEKEFELKLLKENNESKLNFEISKAILEKEKELVELKNTLELNEVHNELAKKSLQEKYEIELRQKDETIAFYKDFKAKQSTKLIGESLEQHCENEFNKLRMTAFPNAIFTKDNDVKTGSKGDYIYKEYDESGLEIISIMFEMKNENDETATKKKNENFFKELDKDRREKDCEYAVLVSMLESESEFYNNGIVDVSYQYEKMYVVRPQFFIPIITLLRNAALNSLKYKKEMSLIKEQNIDITNFEEDLEKFKEAFSKNYNSASKNFIKAIEEIDKSIKRMEEVKKFLTTSENQLRLANNKLEDVTIKKLTRKNPTMKRKFERL